MSYKGSILDRIPNQRNEAEIQKHTENPKNTTENITEHENETTTDGKITYKQTFANVTKNQFVINQPKKDQGIILNAIEGIQINEYIYEIGKLVEPKNILAASRLSNQRICLYLTSKIIVDNLLEKTTSLKIKGQITNIRRLITPSKKIVLSNVCPTIPNNIIEKELLKVGLKITSPIYFIRMGLPLPEYSHIISFRRYTYIIPNDNEQIPETILVNYDGDEYRIFIQSDYLKCYRCNKLGHIASNCTTTLENIQIIQTNTETLAESPAETLPVKHKSENKPMEINEENAEQNKKRPFTNTSIDTNTPLSSDEEEMPKIRNNKKSKQKKLRKDEQNNTLPIEEMLKPVEEIILKQNQITYQQLTDFIKEVQTARKPLEVARKHFPDVENLLITLSDIYPSLKHRKIKYRVTRIISNIKKAIIREEDISEISPSQGDEIQTTE